MASWFSNDAGGLSQYHRTAQFIEGDTYVKVDWHLKEKLWEVVRPLDDDGQRYAVGLFRGWRSEDTCFQRHPAIIKVYMQIPDQTPPATEHVEGRPYTQPWKEKVPEIEAFVENIDHRVRNHCGYSIPFYDTQDYEQTNDDHVPGGFAFYVLMACMPGVRKGPLVNGYHHSSASNNDLDEPEHHDNNNSNESERHDNNDSNEPEHHDNNNSNESEHQSNRDSSESERHNNDSCFAAYIRYQELDSNS
ncbi:hypothetical protein P170DRAFT_480022 [Aspergillus steynii IBT 23096]|uniref:Uncharacterized protein n=1 Tax=Aspergillus steynii IBT 23096 TaxID=1392250 RepID=A0A2I2FUI4_9EURO|nr:uncharacterized protein P170DRAFT_480022 [Aspergillus steynii IBT 23096]PLB44257.1 hypothetical protein P170DRAFT_480022 [Aspergillus steynii IBT 23096]